MNNGYLFISLYNKLLRLTEEKKCAWEMSSEVSVYYLQLQSSMIRVGEDNSCTTESPVYIFQYVKEDKLFLDRKVKPSDINEYGLLSSLYHNIEVYYNEIVSNSVNEVNLELDKL